MNRVETNRLLWFALVLGACGDASTMLTPDAEPPSPDAATLDGGEFDGGSGDRPVVIGPHGYFTIDGVRTVVVGVEEERSVLTDAQVDALIPRLREAGVNFVIVYLQNLGSDYFYDELEREGIYVAQHLGTLKRETSGGFSNTGGVIGTVPDEAWLHERLADIEATVPRLARRRNILFWWLGGELVEPEFHTPEGIATVRDHVRRYRDAIQGLDPLDRPFTVSHHYVEAIEDAALPYVDYADLTDFTWFTVATHFHLGDFVSGGGWWPVAQVSEPSIVLGSVLRHAWELNGERPIFFGGWFGQAPLLGPCNAADQGERVHEKWAAIASVPHVGYSTYHLDEWGDNGIPHALFEWTGSDWIPTPAGRALREIALDTDRP